MILDLTQLKIGQSGKVIEIRGDVSLVKKLESMGIRPSKEITKIGAQFWRGPQIVKVGNSEIAIGFGMAKRVLIEVENEKSSSDG